MLQHQRSRTLCPRIVFSSVIPPTAPQLTHFAGSRSRNRSVGTPF
jgi:hypothetical protein